MEPKIHVGCRQAGRRGRNSAQFMIRSTTISTRNVISSPTKSTNRDARPRLTSGARLWPDSRLEFVLSRQKIFLAYTHRGDSVLLPYEFRKPLLSTPLHNGEKRCGRHLDLRCCWPPG